MSASADDILNAAMQLSEPERFHIVERLLETLPDDMDEMPGLSEDDPGLMAELERRAADKDNHVPLSELWKQD
jgi:hypothetical protein